MHDSKRNISDYFRSSRNRVANKRTSDVLTNKIHKEFRDFFSGIDCFEGTFTLQVKEGSWPYQALPKKGRTCIAGTPKERARKATKVA